MVLVHLAFGSWDLEFGIWRLVFVHLAFHFGFVLVFVHLAFSNCALGCAFGLAFALAFNLWHLAQRTNLQDFEIWNCSAKVCANGGAQPSVVVVGGTVDLG